MVSFPKQALGASPTYISLKLVQQGDVLIRQPHNQASLDSPLFVAQISAQDGLPSGERYNGWVVCGSSEGQRQPAGMPDPRYSPSPTT